MHPHLSAATSACPWSSHCEQETMLVHGPEHTLLFPSSCLWTSNREVGAWPGCAQLQGAREPASIKCVYVTPTETGKKQRTGPLRPRLWTMAWHAWFCSSPAPLAPILFHFVTVHWTEPRDHQTPCWQASCVSNTAERACAGNAVLWGASFTGGGEGRAEGYALMCSAVVNSLQPHGL